MQYYKWHWNEPRGDKYSSWGESTWYFEISEDNSYSRVLQVYKSGHALLYTVEHLGDEYGILPEGYFGAPENGEVAISKQDFERLVLNTPLTNSPKSI